MTVLNTFSTTDIVLADNETLIVTETGTLAEAGIENMTDESGQSIFVSGEVLSNGRAVDLEVDRDATLNARITIGEGGKLWSANSNALFLQGGLNHITNNGEISSDFEAIKLSSLIHNHEIINNGTISSNRAAIDIAGQISGPFASSIANTGRIVGHDDAIVGRSDLAITNSGDILATGAASTGILARNGILQVVNTGTVQSSQFAIHAMLATDTSTVINSGSLIGNVLLEGANARVENTGLIDGFVTMTDGNDTFINSGTVLGAVNLGDGNDMAEFHAGSTEQVNGGDGNDQFFVWGGAPIIDGGNGFDTVSSTGNITMGNSIERAALLGVEDTRVWGSQANDVIDGNAGDNRLVGNKGADQIKGGLGNDTLKGGADLDQLLGGYGDDVLKGGTGRDIMRGEEDDDLLKGGFGDDDLYGGAGNDTLMGGRGRDNLTGDEGLDTFVFTHKFDSGRTLANADTIHDFKRGEDLIDVSAMVEGEFTFIKGVALTGTGQAELRIKANPTENWTKVFWDTNGDGKFEGMLYLRNVIGLTADDFIL